MFKKTKYIPPQEFFPKDFTDIHSHLIPGIDDGAKTMEESMALIRQMGEYGVRDIITTPHVMAGVYRNTPERILEIGKKVIDELSDFTDLSELSDDPPSRKALVGESEEAKEQEGDLRDLREGETGRRGEQSEFSDQSSSLSRSTQEHRDHRVILSTNQPINQSTRLRFAAEYMLDEGFTKHLESGLLTLKEKMVLVEMSYLSPPVNLYELLFELQLKGYEPVLAHPERYGFYHKDQKQYDKLKEHGCHFQLNLLSLTSHYGKSVQKTAIKLVESEMIDFLGTDTHHMGHLGLWKRVATEKNRKLLEGVFERQVVFET